jgi:holo-[acyl-carrier protein] synthase
MTVRVGIDLVDVQEVAASVSRFGARYLRRVFAPEEIAACGAGTDSRRLSACFAAKEATVKALALDDRHVDWPSIEVQLPQPSRRASVELSGTGAELAISAGIVSLSADIVTTQDHALAIVIATGQGGS